MALAQKRAERYSALTKHPNRSIVFYISTLVGEIFGGFGVEFSADLGGENFGGFGAKFSADLAKFSAGLGRFSSPLACVVAAYVVEFSPLLSGFCAA